MKTQLLSLIAVTVLLASCGGANNNSEATNADSKEIVTTEETSTQTSSTSNTVEVVANDQMKFSASEFNVKAGEEITLTLKNVGTMAKEAMGHNILVLKPGTNVEEFAQAAMASKATDYIPASFESSIVAHSKLLGPGESDTITFILEKGEFEFICSFPGHYGSMRGKIVAE